MEAWEHIAPELPPEWSVENSGDMDYQQNWATRAADGTVTERGFCGREYAAEDCWEQFGITRKRYAELIAVERVREVAREKHPKCTVRLLDNAECWPQFDVLIFDRDLESWITVSCGSGPTLCDAAWACIQALGGGE